MVKVMAFGTFDILHAGHIHMLREAKAYGDFLVVVVARDVTVLAVKHHSPKNSEEERLKNLQNLNIADKVMPGFGEQMRQISLNFVPTAILSRQVAVIRKECLIINLPGQPKAIAQTLEGLKDEAGNIKVHGIFAAVPYCLDLLATPELPMPYLETNEALVKAFRPKSAIKRGA